MKILFSDEKMFDINGIRNFQNDQIWTVNRSAADTKGGLRQKRRFPQKVMVLLGVCSKGVSSLVIFEDGTMDHDRYIKEMTCLEPIGLSSKTMQSRTFIQNHRNGVLSTFLIPSIRTIGLQTVLI